MAKFNVINFRKETKGARNSFKNIAKNAALAKFNRLKHELLEEFDEHDVTKEIKGGPDAQNISNTLGGRGNLFSFIGFEAGSDPIDVVREALEQFIVMDEVAVIEDKGDKVLFKFPVKKVTLRNLYDITPLPWESGRSWLQGIEKGISGLGYYIYWKVLPNPPSRSGTGIQGDNLLRGGSFSPRPYISKIMANFNANLK